MAIVVNKGNAYEPVDHHWHGDADHVHGSGGDGIPGANAEDLIVATDTTAARSLGDRFAESPHVEDWRGYGGDSTDTGTIQAAFNNCPMGTLRFGAQSYFVVNTLVLGRSNILLEGAGANSSHDVGALGTLNGTTLAWSGVAGGTILTIASPSGASAQHQSGGGVRRMVFDRGAGGAGYGLRIHSWSHGVFENLYFVNFATAGMELNTVSPLGEGADCAHNQFRMIFGRQVEINGSFIILDGGNGNSCFNYFTNIGCVFANTADCLIFANCDNNNMEIVHLYRASGAANACVFRGSNVGEPETARFNIVRHYSTNASTLAQGTPSRTHPSHNNFIYDVDDGNNTPSPTIEAGASLFFTRTASTEYVNWTPTITASAGVITTTSVVNARYKRYKDTVEFDTTFLISNNGTGSGSLRFTLPLVAAYGASCTGYDSGSNNNIIGKIAPASNTVNLTYYNGNYPGPTGNYVTVSGRYQV